MSWFLLASPLAGCIAEVADEEPTEETTAALDLQGDGRSANMEIPLVAVLWEHAHYTGRKRELVRDEPNFGTGQIWTRWLPYPCVTPETPTGVCVVEVPAGCRPGIDFDNQASAIGVHPGPDYESWKARHGGAEPTVTLYEHENFTGRSVMLTAGQYPNLGWIGFNDMGSSLRFNDSNRAVVAAPFAGAHVISPIPVVVRLHTAALSRASSCYEADNVITIVEPVHRMSAEQGGRWHDGVSWVEVLRGPSYPGWAAVDLFENEWFGGDSRRITSAPHDSQLEFWGFNDKASSAWITR